MKKVQLSVEVTKAQRDKLNIHCRIIRKEQKEVVSEWIDTLPEYVAKE